ncbi:MAG: exopolyphosphatase, partial [Pseudomonadota bacterium]
MLEKTPRPPPLRPQSDWLSDIPPSFAPASKRHAADRIGVIDVGSNSVRLVVFEGHCRSPAKVYDEKVMCGLGAQLQQTGALDPAGKARTMAALKRFAALAGSLGLGALTGVGTAALRDAVDGPAFRDELAEKTGIRLAIATGADEARLAGQGVLFGNPGAEGVVIDLGGASLEFARLADGAVVEGLTTPLGPLRLKALIEKGGDADAEIRRYLETLVNAYHLDGGMLYLVGGSWRALAKAQILRSRYPVGVLHEFAMDRRIATNLCRWAARQTPEQLGQIQGLSANRVGNMPLTAT